MIDQLEQAIANVDRLDWRIVQEDDGYWYAWFHPDWQANPVRIVLADEEPSKNEIAAIAALQLMLEHAPKLMRLARAVADEKAAVEALNQAPARSPEWFDAYMHYSRALLAVPVALADLEAG